MGTWRQLILHSLQPHAYCASPPPWECNTEQKLLFLFIPCHGEKIPGARKGVLHPVRSRFTCFRALTLVCLGTGSWCCGCRACLWEWICPPHPSLSAVLCIGLADPQTHCGCAFVHGCHKLSVRAALRRSRQTAGLLLLLSHLPLSSPLNVVECPIISGLGMLIQDNCYKFKTILGYEELKLLSNNKAI